MGDIFLLLFLLLQVINIKGLLQKPAWNNLKCGIMHQIWFIQPWEKKTKNKKKTSEFTLLVIIHYNG